MFTAQWFRFGGSVAHHLTRRYMQEVIMLHNFKEKEIVKLRYKHFRPAIQKLSQLSDPLSLVLSIHLLSENMLDELIRLIFEEKADAILNLRLNYAKKLELVSAFELEKGVPVLVPDIRGSLKKLNNFRNNLAHRFDYEFTNEMLHQLYVDNLFDLDELKGRPVHRNLYDYAVIVLPGMFPYVEEDTGDICI
ncbi:hypothetical protein [Vibrio furnissii]|uniref:hypothetical protein n=1 Tax=Vibrio furnissii TaxID=29494 RepID=UPI0012F929F0|nr:hypothetical protein [Vibrio furnissii]